jgi:hypothetical protein
MKVKFPEGHGHSFTAEGKEYPIDKHGVAKGLTTEHAAIATSFGAESLSDSDPVVPSEDEDNRTELEMVLDGTVDEVLEAITEWNDEALILLVDYETNGKARKGVLEGIAAEQKRRADAEAAK